MKRGDMNRDTSRLDNKWRIEQDRQTDEREKKDIKKKGCAIFLF